MIIDAHAHCGKSVGMFMYMDSIEQKVEYMDKVGCDYAIQSIAGGALNACVDRDAVNNYISMSRAIYEKSKGRILAYMVYSPLIVEKSVEMIHEIADDPAFVGIKIHPSAHYVSADDERYRPVWELAGKYNLPLMSHTWALTSNPKQVYSLPHKFEKYLKEYPETKFIFGHSGGRISGIREAMELGKKYKNTYFDIAGDIYDRGLIEYLVSSVGADRVMVASDFNWFEFSVSMGMILGANITPEEKELILGKTASKVFGIR